MERLPLSLLLPGVTVMAVLTAVAVYLAVQPGEKRL